MVFDVTIIGGGIVGLATAMTLAQTRRTSRVLLVEKEERLAAHQTGRNSGVIHSGIYYKPGSLKARMAKEGNASMVRFCREHGIQHDICGKLIAAVTEAEIPRLETLLRRGQENGLAIERITPERAREIEPHVNCVAALLAPSTGIVSYRMVAGEFARLAEEAGAEVKLGTRVENLRTAGDRHVVETSRGAFETRFVVNCAGLHSDRISRMDGCEPGARIVPFRGEYYELRPERRHLVRGLIYPVPDPAFPFLGVHFTRMIDGSVHAGPNAVLAFAREGYRKRDIDLRDLGETLAYGGFWKLAPKHWSEGGQEMWRSFSRRAFVDSLQQLIPEVTDGDVVPCASGVRAQALRPDGSMVDDFLFVRGRNTLHVCNAPSPAATASLEIAKAVTEQIPDMERTVVAA